MAEQNPDEAARSLVDELGPPEAWQHATGQAIDAHLRRDEAASAYWAEVHGALKVTALRPGAGDLDIYKSAKGLIREHGSTEAWRHAMQQAVEAEGDLPREATWLRIADAVSALGRKGLRGV